jgi:hypothetical protein
MYISIKAHSRNLCAFFVLPHFCPIVPPLLNGASQAVHHQGGETRLPKKMAWKTTTRFKTCNHLMFAA